MKNCHYLAWSGVFLALAGWLALTESPGLYDYARAQVRNFEDSGGQVVPSESDGIEVLTQGPVHEAFAQPATGRLGATVVVTKKPPAPIEELPPASKPDGENVVWISGYWAWDVDREDFIWVSGLWRQEPVGKDWVPGYWDEADGGWRWVSGYWGMQGQADVELLPPPPAAIVEAPPPQSTVESSYSPGVWVYREQRYLWRPGFWVPYRPGWVWCHAHYVWTPGGYVFVDGHWDYDYHHRGLLFAPAYFQPRYFAAGQRPIYRPLYAINSDLLLAALFVRPAANHFVFGDYFDPRYSGLGITAWVDFRTRNRWYDPVWDYYRWQNRGNPRWERDLRDRYVDLRQNIKARPPRTLAEQQRLLTTKSTQQIALVRPLDKLPATNIKLRSVTKIEAQQIQKTVLHNQEVRQQRVKAEAQVRAQGAEVGSRSAVTVKLPKAARVQSRTVGAPPLPVVPKFQAKPPGAKVDIDDRPDPLPQKKGNVPGKKGPPKVDLPKGKGVEQPPPKLNPPAPPKVNPKAPPPQKTPPLPKGKKKDKDDEPQPLANARFVLPVWPGSIRCECQPDLRGRLDSTARARNRVAASRC